MAVKIFFCYAHEDEEILNKLKSHLWPLYHQGLIEVWHDREISAGSEWEYEISQHLNAAQIILLLVSSDFMSSKYCYGVEMKRALERHEHKEATVIPVIVRPIYWQGVLGNIQALPTNAKPLVDRSWHTLDEALYDVAEGIRKVVVRLVPQPPPKLLPPLKPEALSLLHTLTTHIHSVSSVAFSPDGQTLASNSRDGTIKLWNPATGNEVRTLTGHTDDVCSVAFSPDGQTLASGSNDHMIKLWNPTTGNEVRTLTGHTFPVTSVAFSPDGQTLASGSRDRSIKLWNLASSQEVRTLQRDISYRSFVESVAFSPDGQILASGCGDSTIKLWNLIAGEVYILKGHIADISRGTIFPFIDVSSVAFSPDGQTLVSGSAGLGGTIKFWNVARGQEVRTLTEHKYGVSSIAFSPDGQILASGGGDCMIKLWNMARGQEVRTLERDTFHTSPVRSIAFSPDGQTLASGNGNGTINIWGKK